MGSNDETGLSRILELRGMGKYFRLVVCDCSCCVDGCSSIIISGRVDMTSAAHAVHTYLLIAAQLISIMTTDLHHNTDN